MKKNLHPIFQLLVFLGILAGPLGAAHATTCSYTLDLPSGTSLVANQCELRAGNTLNNLFPNVPNGSKVTKYINNPPSEDVAVFNNGAWTPNLTLDPGEGAYFENPGPALTVTISGERNTLGWPLRLYSNFQIVSRREPLVSHFTASEGWMASAEDSLVRWDPVKQTYSDTYFFNGSEWVGADGITPVQFAINVGESVLYYNASGSTIDPCNAAIRWQPTDVAVVQRCCPNQTDCATFSVDAIGTAPFTYQWFANDVLISGATDATYTLCPVTVADSGTRISVRVSNACKVLTSEVATLTVTRDPTPPVLTGLSAIAVQCDVDVPAPNPGSISAVDACGSPLLVMHAGDAASGSCPKTITRTYNATDSCGNVGTFTQSITVLPPPSTRSGLCGFSQGFYGNVNGKFNGVTSRTLVGNLLGQGPLVVGILGARSLSIEPGDGDLLQLRMPSGGTPTALPANGDQTLLTPSVPLNRKGRFDNVLLGQTITLSLNVRLSRGLANVGIAPSFCTQAVLPGPDGRRGTEDDELVSGDIMTFQIPDAVRMALANPILGIQDSTVRGLLELANRALAGLPTGGASWSAVNDAVDSINCGFDECRQLVDCTTGQPIPDSFNDGFEQRPTLGGGNAPQGGMRLAAVEPPGNLRGRVTNLRATKEPGEPDHAGHAGGKSVWWRWVCPRTGPVLLTTTGSSIDTILAVYTGSALENLASVASNDDSEDGARTHSELIFEGVAGTEYQIAVDSFEGGIGTIVLSLIIDRPRLNPPALGPNDAVALEVEGPRGRTYTVEASSDLLHWTPITSQRNADGVLRFKDPAGQVEPHRFYRAALEF